mmetsp:Transcript_12402/g.30022  ORF Transcript_12402/g.30022 Transcript_12402/m.30022 type:complete len:256 (-) Transcript_12402:82-849(-)
MITFPSHPPVAKVPCVGWNASALTGYTVSTPLASCARWHLNAYFLLWNSGAASKYSIATRPSIDESAYPSPFGYVRMQRVWNFSDDSRFCSGSESFRTSYTHTWRFAVPTTMRFWVTAIVNTLSGTSVVDWHLAVRVSHTLTCLSHPPDTTHPSSFCQQTAFTAFSCSPTTVSVDVAKSYVFTTLSTPPEKHRFWSTPQQQSSTAALCVYVARFAFMSTSYMRTSVFHDETRSRLCSGAKIMAEMPSFGGSASSD